MDFMIQVNRCIWIICLNIIPVGYPAEAPADIHRKPVNEVVFYDKWR
ncbi:MAG: hypothetical protein K0R50_925 [Eubacterium sp.]|nr:hypothetical protein [Eubacterium sp.]